MLRRASIQDDSPRYHSHPTSRRPTARASRKLSRGHELYQARTACGVDGWAVRSCAGVAAAAQPSRRLVPSPTHSAQEVGFASPRPPSATRYKYRGYAAQKPHDTQRSRMSARAHDGRRRPPRCQRLRPCVARAWSTSAQTRHISQKKLQFHFQSGSYSPHKKVQFRVLWSIYTIYYIE